LFIQTLHLQFRDSLTILSLKFFYDYRRLANMFSGKENGLSHSACR